MLLFFRIKKHTWHLRAACHSGCSTATVACLTRSLEDMFASVSLVIATACIRMQMLALYISPNKYLAGSISSQRPRERLNWQLANQTM
jgi:hypothetical protein